MNYRQLVHNTQHVTMGCGPMNQCVACRGMGDTAPENQPLITERELKKWALLAIFGAIVSGVVSELVVRRMIFKKKG